MIIKFDASKAETYKYAELQMIVEGYENHSIYSCAITYEQAKTELNKRKSLLTENISAN